MGFWDSFEQTVVVHESDGKKYWVKVVSEFDYQTTLDIQSMIVSKIDSNGKAVQNEIDPKAFNAAVLQALILDWNIPSIDNPDSVLPHSTPEELSESLLHIPSSIINKLIKLGMEAMNRERSVEAEAQFPSSPDGSD